MSEEEYHANRATCPECGGYKPVFGKLRKFYRHGAWRASQWTYPCPGSLKPAPPKEVATSGS